MGRKRVEIIIETERVVHISSRSKSLIFWCDSCGRPVPALTLSETAVVFGMRAEEILRKIADRELHLIQMAESLPRICSISLFK